MDFFLIVLKVLFWFGLIHLLYGVIGLLLVSLCSFKKHKHLHRAGVRLLAMSFFCDAFLPDHCQMDCSNTKCGNWTCPNYHRKD